MSSQDSGMQFQFTRLSESHLLPFDGFSLIDVTLMLKDNRKAFSLLIYKFCEASAGKRQLGNLLSIKRR